MTKNTKAIIWATVAVIMIIISSITYERQRPKRLATQKTPIVKITAIVPVQDQIPAPTQAATSTADTINTSTPASKFIPFRKPKPAPPKPLSYGDTVVKYASSRIQFNSSCQAIPSQMAIANLVTIMLDNRSNAAQTITVAGHSYSVAAYNYVLVALNQKNLPIHLLVNCNSQVNTAEILLQ
ncbi:MAG: hypothetical protein M1383_05295 [Patescibacteria group bacterium]|nr:hypothetical protein [Patescibacteria group bacterium]